MGFFSGNRFPPRIILGNVLQPSRLRYLLYFLNTSNSSVHLHTFSNENSSCCEEDPVWISTGILFEYDLSKSKHNENKHHIDFEKAKALWADEDRITIPAKSETEPRFALLAQLDGQILAAFYTLRGDSIRVISVRRARENERQLYDGGRT